MNNKNTWESELLGDAIIAPDSDTVVSSGELKTPEKKEWYEAVQEKLEEPPVDPKTTTPTIHNAQDTASDPQPIRSSLLFDEDYKTDQPAFSPKKKSSLPSTITNMAMFILAVASFLGFFLIPSNNIVSEINMSNVVNSAIDLFDKTFVYEVENFVQKQKSEVEKIKTTDSESIPRALVFSAQTANMAADYFGGLFEVIITYTRDYEAINIR